MDTEERREPLLAADAQVTDVNPAAVLVVKRRAAIHVEAGEVFRGGDLPHEVPQLLLGERGQSEGPATVADRHLGSLTSLEVQTIRVLRRHELEDVVQPSHLHVSQTAATRGNRGAF